MRRAAAALAVALLTLLVATGSGTPTPAGAQTDTAQTDTAQTDTAQTDAEEAGPRPMEVALREIEAVLPADDPDAVVSADLELAAGPAARADLRLVTTVFTRIEDRSALRRAFDGDLPSVFSAQSADLPDLAAGTTRVVRAEAARADLSLQVPDRAGVYPLQFQVFEGPEPVGAVLTSLVLLPEVAPPALPTTTVVRLVDTASAPLAADVAAADLEALVDPDAPLRRATDDLQRAMADGSAAGITVVPSGRLLGDLVAMADGFQRADGTTVDGADRVARRAGATVETIRGITQRADTEVLSVPYGPADLVALVRGGLEETARELLALGAEQTAAVLGTDVREGIVVPPDGLDGASLAALGPALPDAILLDARHLSFAEEDVMEPVRRLRTADGGEVRILVPDADLSAVLSDPHGEGTAAVVQRLLAETAVQWLDTAGTLDRASTAVLLSVDGLQPLPADVVATVTAAIADAPWLRPVALSQLAAEVAPADRVVRLAYPPRSAASELDGAYIDRLGQAQQALVPLRALLGEDDPTPDRYARSLTLAASLGYREAANRAAGDARSAEVLSRLSVLTDAVQVVSSAPITLTAATGEVPVTLINSGDVPVRVRVQLSSTRFEFDDDSQELTLQPNSAQQLGFVAEALNPGGFAAITVTVDDIEGGLTLTQSRISVRSTAFPVVGLIAVVGSGIVLLTWGVRQSLRRRRRPGRHEQASQDRAGVA